MTEKRPFLEREEMERKVYKAKMEAFKCNLKLEKSLADKSLKSTAFGLQKVDQRHDLTSFPSEESHARYYGKDLRAMQGSQTVPGHLSLPYVHSPSFIPP